MGEICPGFLICRNGWMFDFKRFQSGRIQPRVHDYDAIEVYIEAVTCILNLKIIKPTVIPKKFKNKS